VKVLFINPSKWGRGITPIWIASHTGLLKENGVNVTLFDATFFKDWAENELSFNTANGQYKKSNYEKLVTFQTKRVLEALQEKIDDFEPDIIFWSALSSHIHGEGEYVNIEYGYELVSNIKTKALFVTAGLQATASADTIFKQFPLLNFIIQGYSEFPLLNICKSLSLNKPIQMVEGVVERGSTNSGKKPQHPNIQELPQYDYSLFEDQVFYRPYQGKVVRAVDYEFSRGCIYSCHYCVETVIQRFYDFNEVNRTGSIKNSNQYVRTKTASRIYEELKYLASVHKIDFVRAQDTNFLTVDRSVLRELSDLLDNRSLNLEIYIETRPEGINSASIELLKKLNVVGVGMGIELASEAFRESSLGRFSSTTKIINAFQLLKEAGIRRTAYNIIGLPNQDEDSIIETIKFNALIQPDDITVAFYSPYIGTTQSETATELKMFDKYETKVDGQMRSLTKDSTLDLETLEYYKANFVKLCKSANIEDN